MRGKSNYEDDIARLTTIQTVMKTLLHCDEEPYNVEFSINLGH